MSSNSTSMNNNNNSCGLSEAYYSATTNAYWLAYFGLTPFYFAFGLVGQLIALLAFYKQSKTESVYVFQVSITISRLLEVCSFSVCVFCLQLLADYNGTMTGGEGGAAWFRSVYWLMWYAARVSTALKSTFITIPMLVTSAMAVDRAFGLLYPLKYRTMNAKWCHGAAIVIIYTLGVITGAESGFRWTVSDVPVRGDGVYKIASTPYVSTNASKIWSQIRFGVRFVSLIILILASCIMIKKIKTKNVIVGNMTQRKEEAKENEKRLKEKMVLQMAIFQTVSTGLSVLLLCCYNIGTSFISGTFISCEGPLIAYLADIVLQFVSMVDFYIMFAVNAGFRRMVIRGVVNVLKPFAKIISRASN